MTTSSDLEQDSELSARRFAVLQMTYQADRGDMSSASASIFALTSALLAYLSATSALIFDLGGSGRAITGPYAPILMAAALPAYAILFLTVITTATLALRDRYLRGIERELESLSRDNSPVRAPASLEITARIQDIRHPKVYKAFAIPMVAQHLIAVGLVLAYTVLTVEKAWHASEAEWKVAAVSLYAVLIGVTAFAYLQLLRLQGNEPAVD